MFLPRTGSLVIENLGAEGWRKVLAQDVAALMRVLEIAMVLNDEKTYSAQNLEKLWVANEKL